MRSRKNSENVLNNIAKMQKSPFSSYYIKKICILYMSALYNKLNIETL